MPNSPQVTDTFNFYFFGTFVYTEQEEDELNMEEKSSNDISKYFLEFSKGTRNVFFVYHAESKEFLYLNAAFEQIWNIPVNSAKSNPAALLDTIHPEDKDYMAANFRRLLKGEKRNDIEFRIKLNGGQIKWLCLNAFLQTEEAGNQHSVTGIVEDITKTKENYAILEKFAAKKNSILEILSHDLAGPLTNIESMSSLIAEEIKTYKNTELEKMVDMVSKTSTRSVKMIREFVQQEFLASANSSTVRKRVNIVQKLWESMDQYKSTEEFTGKKFSFSASDEEIFLKVDDYKFMQVINNLISNSIKFTRDGGTISVSVKDKQESVFFTVADNGIGIPAKYHDKLFDKFTKARRKGLKGEPSTGLGMSIIKTIVEWHNGKIWFSSTENEGTTFYIELPKE